MGIQTDANIAQFLSDISPWAPAYRFCGLSYLAARNGAAWTLLHGRLFLSARPLHVSKGCFWTEHIVAGHIPIELSTNGYDKVIKRLFSTGEMEAPIGTLVLQKDNSGSRSSHYLPFHPEGLTGQNRLSVLTMSGRSRHGLIDQPGTDWELRAAVTPFESLVELSGEYSLGGYSGDATVVEVVANSVVWVASDCSVSGTRAEIAMLAAPGLEENRCRIGYRVMNNRKVGTRGSFDGNQLSWSDKDLERRGVAEIDVPQAAVIHCFASYGNRTQHHYWISDPKNYQNPLRMALQANDPDLAILRDYLFEEKKPRKEARDFECGVALLAWMLGFSAANSGLTQRLADAPDIIASTPSGDMLVVECTTGLLKAENKLAKLVERAHAVRSRLDASGNNHVRVLPVIVTAMERGSVEAELSLARSSFVSVATKELLVELLGQTVGISDAQRVFDNLWSAVQAEKTGAQSPLAGIGV